MIGLNANFEFVFGGWVFCSLVVFVSSRDFSESVFAVCCLFHWPNHFMGSLGVLAVVGW